MNEMMPGVGSGLSPRCGNLDTPSKVDTFKVNLFLQGQTGFLGKLG